MSRARPPAAHGQPVRARMLSLPLVLVLLCSLGMATSFYLLLSVVPWYATTVGAGGVGAGLATGALMLATVAAELVTPRLVHRFGYRLVLAVGLVLLGTPALALPASASLAGILVVCLVRGLGFAIAVVVGSALVASLVPPERRGEGLGLYGVVVGVPSVIALPLGVWLAGRLGFTPVFVAGAISALVGLAAVAGLPGRAPGEAFGLWAGFARPDLVRPCVYFMATTMAAGVVVTFVPLAVSHPAGALAAAALFAQAAAATMTRWWAGRYGDRRGPARLVVPSLLVTAAGMLTLIATPNPVAVLAGTLVFGAGFGVAQNASLALMFQRVAPSGFGTVSAMWNLSYDAGLGVGAAGFGVLATASGYPAAFAVTAAVVLGALAPAWRDRGAEVRVGRRPRTSE